MGNINEKTYPYNPEFLADLTRKIWCYFATYYPNVKKKTTASFFILLQTDVNNFFRQHHNYSEDIIRTPSYLLELTKKYKKTTNKSIAMVEAVKAYLDFLESNPGSKQIVTKNIVTVFAPVSNQLSDIPQLELTRFEDKQFNSKLLFKSRYIPFYGRKSEIELLLNFCKTDSIFEWWTIIGTNGIGKSRIALTFCDLIANSFCAGFLSIHRLKNIDWFCWVPDRDYFIVVDDAHFDADDVANFLAALHENSKKFQHKVRVLILGNANKQFWWPYFQIQIHKETLRPWKPEYTLPVLDKNSISSIEQFIREKEGWNDIVIRHPYQLPPQLQNIPHYKILSTYLYYKDKTVELQEIKRLNFDYKIHDNFSILKYFYLNHLEDCVAYCSENSIPLETLEKHKNLLTYLYLGPGISEESIQKTLDENHLWCVNRNNYSISLFQKLISSHNYEQSELNVIPNVIGQYFVFAHLNLFDTIDRFSTVTKDIFKLAAGSTRFELFYAYLYAEGRRQIISAEKEYYFMELVDSYHENMPDEKFEFWVSNSDSIIYSLIFNKKISEAGIRYKLTRQRRIERKYYLGWEYTISCMIMAVSDFKTKELYFKDMLYLNKFEPKSCAQWLITSLNDIRFSLYNLKDLKKIAQYSKYISRISKDEFFQERLGQLTKDYKSLAEGQEPKR